MYWQLDSRAIGNMGLLGNLRLSTASGQTARGLQKKPSELRRAEDAQSATRASQRRSINTRANQISCHAARSASPSWRAPYAVSPGRYSATAGFALWSLRSSFQILREFPVCAVQPAQFLFKA